MTFLSEANKDATSVSQDAIATGPRVGFFEAFSTSFDAQQRASSLFGLEYYMSELDNEQTKALRDAGVADAPFLLTDLTAAKDGENGLSATEMGGAYGEQLLDWQRGGYYDVAKMAQGDTSADPTYSQGAKAYDAKIAELRKAHPGLTLRTSTEMFGEVAKKAREAEAKEANDRRSWGGTLGSFAGGALAGLHPSTDPLNFATLAVGGAGKTVAGRIGTQAGAQGVIEAVNQIAGVQESRELMGLKHGFGDAATRVGLAAFGGAAFQGVGEGLAAGARRFFRNTPADPAPAPAAIAPDAPASLTPAQVQRLTPDALITEARTARIEQQGSAALLDGLTDLTTMAGSREGKARVQADLMDMMARLEDWNGGPPVASTPRTSVAAYPDAQPTAMRTDFNTALDSNARYQAARENDPAAFGRFEKLTARAQELRGWIEGVKGARGDDLAEITNGINNRLDTLEVKLRTTQGKNAKAKIKKEIAEVRADRASAAKLSSADDTQDVRIMRRELMRTDEQMRDLAPLIGRAHARADGRWQDGAPDMDAVWQAYRAGSTDVQPPVKTNLDAETPMTLHDRVQELQRAPVDTPPNKPVVDVVRDVIAEDVKIQTETLDRLRASVGRVLSEEADGTVTLAGTDHKFNLTDRVFDADGNEVTLRQMLDDIQSKDQELEAITSCSIK